MTKIFAAGIGHETHGFNRYPTTLDQFKQLLYVEGDDIIPLAKGDSGWGGLFDVARDAGWEVVHPLSTFATPGGKVTRDAFETLWQVVEPALKEEGPYDGIFWQLHGGMLTEHLDDPEGEIVRRTREIVGDSVPLAVTLDIHANVSPAMVRQSNIICGYHTTPHVDLKETGFRAASLLRRTLSGEITPIVHSIHLPILEAIDHGRTFSENSPVPVMLKKAEKHMAGDPNLLDVSFLSGFPFCDAPDTGTCAVIVTNGDHPKYRTLLDEFGDYIWETRDYLSVEALDMDTAIQQAAKAHNGSHGPFIIADFTDTCDGGGYGDSPNLLRKMLEYGVSNAAIGALWDSEAVQMAHKNGVGAQITLALGGRCDPEENPPLPMTAYVKALSETGAFVHNGPFGKGQPGRLGRSACLTVGDIDVIVTDHAHGIHDREEFRVFGINPEEKNIISVKGYNHFRADFEQIGRGLVYADSGGIFTLNFKRFEYHHVRRPIWHLDSFKREKGLTHYAQTRKRKR